MIDLTALPDPADHPLAMLIVAQLVVLPTLTAAAARLVRSHPARAHAVITAGLLATVGAPPLTLLAASAGLGFLPGLEITPSAPALAGADDVDDAARRTCSTA